MPKSKNDHIEKTAKVIFKNSRNTINTYSRTYSGASQCYTKSLILRLKQNLPNDEYYEVNGRVKRDLSIETDVCILRGYYKKRRNRFINRGTVSTKSKYSVNRTEIDTIDEFKYDSSACGDSKGSVKLKNAHFNVNLTSLVIQNLKKLLHDWVKKYLLDSNETKDKIETVLDSILHKLDLQSTVNGTVSSCTYTVDVKVIDQKENPISHPKSQAAGQGSFSVPLGGKCLRIFSTLSVPKNINRPKTSKYSLTKLNKIRHKKILLSTNGSSKYLFTSSSLNFLTLPTKFLTKRCATYQQDIPIRKNKEQNKSVVHPEELYGVKNLDSFAYIARNSTLDTIPSIYKNIYKDYKRNEIQNSNSNNLSKKNENQQGSEPKVSIDSLKQSFVNNNNYITQKEIQSSHLIKASIDRKAKKVTRRSKKGTSKLRKHKNIKSKQFTCFLGKSKNHNQQKKELLYHFQSIFKMISSHNCGKDNIKLDIHINVFPSIDNRARKDAVKDCEHSSPLISANVTTPSNPKTMNENLVSHDNIVIPLLDGAFSQAKYILSGDTSRESSDNTPIELPAINYPAKDSQIAQEINELKMIIKSLANTTEKLVNEHLSDKSKNKVISKNYEDVEKVKPSIGVQFSNKFVRGGVVGSGIKLKKDPKKKQREYNPRLMKRSISYNIVDSESLLTVTDMTSAVQGEINVKERIDKAVTCSLPKTKSLFEVSLEKCDEKLLAFRCDDFTKPKEYIYNVCELSNKLHSSYPNKDTCQHLKPPCDEIKTKPEKKLENSETVVSVENNDENLDSICIDIEPKTNGKKLTIRPRTGITCCEGCLYCICLWIPVIAILWLLHEYVLKDYLPEKLSLRRLIWSDRKINDSYFRLTLADLGF